MPVRTNFAGVEKIRLSEAVLRVADWQLDSKYVNDLGDFENDFV